MLVYVGMIPIPIHTSAEDGGIAPKSCKDFRRRRKMTKAVFPPSDKVQVDMLQSVLHFNSGQLQFLKFSSRCLMYRIYLLIFFNLLKSYCTRRHAGMMFSQNARKESCIASVGPD